MNNPLLLSKDLTIINICNTLVKLDLLLLGDYIQLYYKVLDTYLE